MARKLERPGSRCLALRRQIAVLEGRRRSLAMHVRLEHEWRTLQYDAVHALVESQRASVELHRKLISTLHADAVVHRQLRMESIDFASLLEGLHALIREIERTLASISAR